MKLSKDGSDVFLFLFFVVVVIVVVVVLHFITVLAAAFCTACRRLICFGGSPDRRPLQ